MLGLLKRWEGYWNILILSIFRTCGYRSFWVMAVWTRAIGGAAVCL